MLADNCQAPLRPPLTARPTPPPASCRRLPGRSWPLPLRRLRAGCAITPPELLIVFVFCLRPGLPARASGLPLRWGSAWGSGSSGLRRRRTVDYPRPPLNISASSHAPCFTLGLFSWPLQVRRPCAGRRLPSSDPTALTAWPKPRPATSRGFCSCKEKAPVKERLLFYEEPRWFVEAKSPG